MKLIIENTAHIIDFNGVPCRLWRGHTASGIPVEVLVPRLAAMNEPPHADHSEFKRELDQAPAPAEPSRAFPLRMVL